MLSFGPRGNSDEWVRAKAAYLRAKLADTFSLGSAGNLDGGDLLLVAMYYLGRKDAVNEAIHRTSNLFDSMQPEKEYPDARK